MRDHKPQGASNDGSLAGFDFYRAESPCCYLAALQHQKLERAWGTVGESRGEVPRLRNTHPHTTRAECYACIVNPRRACARVTVVTLDAHAREGYGSRRVCLFVCLSVCPSVPALAASASVYSGTHGFLLGFSWINMCGVSKKPSVEKLWREKANMQISCSSPSAAFAQFRDQRNAAAT